MSEPKRRLGNLLEPETSGQRMRPEAIAMRRIVVEMGRWLSPFMRDEPLPVLSEWERTVDLLKLDHNHAARERNANVKRTRTGIDKSNQVLERMHDDRPVSKNERSGRTSQYKVQTEAELREIEAAKAKARRTPSHRAKVPPVVKHDPAVAIARIASVAAEKAEAEAVKTEAARAEKRREVCRKAQTRYAAKIKADPERAEIERAKRREQERARARRNGVKPRSSTR